jgi:hypothetical protein
MSLCCCQGDEDKEPKFYADRETLQEFDPAKHKKYNAEFYYQRKTNEKMQVKWHLSRFDSYSLTAIKSVLCTGRSQIEQCRAGL